MMPEANSLPRIDVAVSGGRMLGVEGSHSGTRLEEPLFAVNLLNTRRPWAYNLYSALAYPGVRRAGGRLLFKGRRGRVVRGEADDLRDTLLIVRYPDGNSFLEMARQPYFGAIGLFRRIGISGFQFGFTAGVESADATIADEGPTPYRGDETCLLWGVSASETPEPHLLDPLLRHCEDHPGISLLFSGQRTARLTVRHREAATTSSTGLAPPLPWDGIAVLAGADEEALDRFVLATADRIPTSLSERSLIVFYRRQY